MTDDDKFVAWEEFCKLLSASVRSESPFVSVGPSCKVFTLSDYGYEREVVGMSGGSEMRAGVLVVHRPTGQARRAKRKVLPLAMRRGRVSEPEA